MKGHRVATILLCMLRLPAWPQDQEKGHHQVLTKLQIFFFELETQWLKAAQEKDPAALNRVVSDDFHLWTSAPPGNPHPSGRVSNQQVADSSGRPLKCTEMILDSKEGRKEEDKVKRNIVGRDFVFRL